MTALAPVEWGIAVGSGGCGHKTGSLWAGCLGFKTAGLASDCIRDLGIGERNLGETSPTGDAVYGACSRAFARQVGSVTGNFAAAQCMAVCPSPPG